MKQWFFIAALLAGMASCSVGKKGITVSNELEMPRTDELLVFSRAALADKLGSVPAGKYVQVKKENGEPVVVQYDDTDGDGEWDEAAWLYSFNAKEKAHFALMLADAPATIKAVVRAHARHMREKQ